MILGVSASIFAFAMTSVSLAIYHNSGDIYLDRSRPGYLPDKEEIEQDDDIKEDEYKFDANRAPTKENLEEYLKNLNAEVEVLEAYKGAFSGEILSDEKFGI